MNTVVQRPVTQPCYGLSVTPHDSFPCRSEAIGAARQDRYAILRNTHPAARACAQARAGVRTYMYFLRNYVTNQEEKKKEQAKAAFCRYAGRYAGVTRNVTALDLPSRQIRAEVTHA